MLIINWGIEIIDVMWYNKTKIILSFKMKGSEMEIINIFAIILTPIAAVFIGQILQNNSEKRKDKMHIFKTLMTSRLYGWTPESVHCLNLIDIVFSDDKRVRAAWKELYDKYCVENPTETDLKKIQNAQYKLLEAMAHSLGYKDKVTWETIQNPYIPNGMVQQIVNQNQSQQAYNSLLVNMQQMMDNGKEDNRRKPKR